MATPAVPVERLTPTEVTGLPVETTASGVTLCCREPADVCVAEAPPDVARPVIPERVGADEAGLPLPIVA